MEEVKRATNMYEVATDNSIKLANIKTMLGAICFFMEGTTPEDDDSVYSSSFKDLLAGQQSDIRCIEERVTHLCAELGVAMNHK